MSTEVVCRHERISVLRLGVEPFRAARCVGDSYSGRDGLRSGRELVRRGQRESDGDHDEAVYLQRLRLRRSDARSESDGDHDEAVYLQRLRLRRSDARADSPGARLTALCCTLLSTNPPSPSTPMREPRRSAARPSVRRRGGPSPGPKGGIFGGGDGIIMATSRLDARLGAVRARL
ncbi:hypothetical protein FKP32DRAFT_530208 [Trametes sanguinea]|nr:hypothetical protein FKP32DRAFT_530208 [Trametes sanguinea]